MIPPTKITIPPSALVSYAREKMLAAGYDPDSVEEAIAEWAPSVEPVTLNVRLVGES